MSVDTIHWWLGKVMIWVIRVYQQTLSVAIGPCCRFSPSCSAYAVECIERFGPGRGLILAFERVLRCHPLNPGGHDPVPDKPAGIRCWQKFSERRIL